MKAHHFFTVLLSTKANRHATTTPILTCVKNSNRRLGGLGELISKRCSRSGRSDSPRIVAARRLATDLSPFFHPAMGRVAG
jgi:hypothetical protein